MKKVLAVLQVLVMAASLGLTAWSLNEAAVQRRAARQAADELARLQAAMADSQGTAAPDPAGAAAPDPAATAAPAGALSRAEADDLAARYKGEIKAGSSIGRVWVEGTQLDCGLYWGDTDAILNLGGGCADYEGCVLPGENGTVFVGGHTGSFFSDLGSAQLGGIIHLETPWGDFRYQISETRVIEETDIAACYWGDTQPRCILYTCYPFGELEHTPQRYLVYADPVAADGQGVLPFAPAA